MRHPDCLNALANELHLQRRYQMNCIHNLETAMPNDSASEMRVNAGGHRTPTWSGCGQKTLLSVTPFLPFDQYAPCIGIVHVRNERDSERSRTQISVCVCVCAVAYAQEIEKQEITVQPMHRPSSFGCPSGNVPLLPVVALSAHPILYSTYLQCSAWGMVRVRAVTLVMPRNGTTLSIQLESCARSCASSGACACTRVRCAEYANGTHSRTKTEVLLVQTRGTFSPFIFR